MTRKKRRSRKRFTAEKKFEIVKLVISKSKTVSEISKEYDIHPNQFYTWQKEFYDSALSGFKEKSMGRTKAAEEREKERLKNKIVKLNSVISTILEENIELKKNDLE